MMGTNAHFEHVITSLKVSLQVGELVLGNLLRSQSLAKRSKGCPSVCPRDF